jgi:hypothetical protein
MSGASFHVAPSGFTRRSRRDPECARLNLSGMPPVYTGVPTVCTRWEPPALAGGRSALALRKNAASSQRALALGTHSGACAATLTTQCCHQFLIPPKTCASANVLRIDTDDRLAIPMLPSLGFAHERRSSNSTP